MNIEELRLTNEEMASAAMIGRNQWQDEMERFWSTDGADYPEREEHFVRRAISQDQLNKVLSYPGLALITDYGNPKLAPTILYLADLKEVEG